MERQNQFTGGDKMPNKPIKPANNQANMQNANKGTPGVNKQYAQVHGNRGAQLNPNRKSK